MRWFWTQRLEQTLCQPWSVENRSQQQKAAAGVSFAGGLDHDIADLRVAGKAFRDLQQPHIELVLRGSQVLGQLSVIALRVVH